MKSTGNRFFDKTLSKFRAIIKYQDIQISRQNLLIAELRDRLAESYGGVHKRLRKAGLFEHQELKTAYLKLTEPDKLKPPSPENVERWFVESNGFYCFEEMDPDFIQWLAATHGANLPTCIFQREPIEG